jgi:hypothetical protein
MSSLDFSSLFISPHSLNKIILKSAKQASWKGLKSLNLACCHTSHDALLHQYGFLYTNLTRETFVSVTYHACLITEDGKYSLNQLLLDNQSDA